jgi:carboxymethylenebutenolidase
MDRVYVRQLVRAFRVGEIDRRTFLKRATLTVGSIAALKLLAACAATPSDAPSSPVVDEEATATTPPDLEQDFPGLVAEMVRYPDGSGGELMGYLARPADASDVQPVVVIQEWWGLNAHIRDVTRRLAEEGFAALAPDLYNGVVTTEPDEAQKLVGELDMQAAVQEIGQAGQYLLDQDYVAGATYGVVGFCLGGALTLQTALAREDIGAAVAFYGRPLSPEEATDVNAPVLGLYGSDDQGIPVSDVRAMETAFEEAGIAHEIQVYDGAGHAFFNDTRESFAPEAAEDAWPRTLDWFREYL